MNNTCTFLVSIVSLLAHATTLPGDEHAATVDCAAIAESSPGPSADAVAKTQPPLTATARRPDSRIRFIIEDERTIIDITSEFGIDRAIIKRTSDNWPQPLVVRAHLKGLESFKVQSGGVAVEWSASREGKQGSRVTLWRGRDESELTQDSPYYTEARFVDGGEQLPPEGGYFEIPLPAKLFKANPQEITLRWIDFYRN